MEDISLTRKGSKSSVDSKWFFLRYQNLNASVFPKRNLSQAETCRRLWNLQDRMTKLHGKALAVGSLEASPQLSETLASRKGENGSKTIEINKKQNKRKQTSRGKNLSFINWIKGNSDTYHLTLEPELFLLWGTARTYTKLLFEFVINIYLFVFHLKKLNGNGSSSRVYQQEKINKSQFIPCVVALQNR